MSTVQMSDEDANQIKGLLLEVGRNSQPRPDLAENANYFAAVVYASMDRLNAQSLSWLLADIGGEDQMPRQVRRSSIYWAAYVAALV